MVSFSFCQLQAAHVSPSQGPGENGRCCGFLAFGLYSPLHLGSASTCSCLGWTPSLYLLLCPLQVLILCRSYQLAFKFVQISPDLENTHTHTYTEKQPLVLQAKICLTVLENLDKLTWVKYLAYSKCTISLTCSSTWILLTYCISILICLGSTFRTGHHKPCFMSLSLLISHDNPTSLFFLSFSGCSFSDSIN